MVLVLFPWRPHRCMSVFRICLCLAVAVGSVSTSLSGQDPGRIELVRDSASPMLAQMNQRSKLMRSESSKKHVSFLNRTMQTMKQPEQPPNPDVAIWGPFQEGSIIYSWQLMVNCTLEFPYVHSALGGNGEHALHVKASGEVDLQDSSVCMTGSSLRSPACSWQYDYNTRLLRSMDPALCDGTEAYECCLEVTDAGALAAKQCSACDTAAGGSCNWCPRLLQETGRLVAFHPVEGSNCEARAADCSVPDTQCKCLAATDKENLLQLIPMKGSKRGYDTDTDEDCRIRLSANPPTSSVAWENTRTSYGPLRDNVAGVDDEPTAGAPDTTFTIEKASALEEQIVQLTNSSLVTEVSMLAALNAEIVLPGQNFVWPAPDLIEKAWRQMIRFDLSLQSQIKQTAASLESVDARAKTTPAGLGPMYSETTGTLCGLAAPCTLDNAITWASGLDPDFPELPGPMSGVGTSVSDCEAACDMHEDCAGFNYYVDTSECMYISVYDGGMSCLATPTTGFNCHEKIPPPPPGEGPTWKQTMDVTCGVSHSSCSTEHPVDWGGGQSPDESMPGHTPTMCQDTCAVKDDCAGFWYDLETQTCHYRSVANGGTSCYQTNLAPGKGDCYEKRSADCRVENPAGQQQGGFVNGCVNMLSGNQRKGCPIDNIDCTIRDTCGCYDVCKQLAGCSFFVMRAEGCQLCSAGTFEDQGISSMVTFPFSAVQAALDGPCSTSCSAPAPISTGPPAPGAEHATGRVKFTTGQARAMLMQLIPFSTGKSGVIDATCIKQGVISGIIGVGPQYQEPTQ